MKKKLSIIVLVLFTSINYGQQDAQFTQYMYNLISINPAYAGTRDKMSAFLQHRTQWVGLDGAPVTNNFSIHSPINDTGSLGLGLSIWNDRIGPSDETDVALSASYSIRTSERYRLSFGVKASANLLNIDFGKSTPYNPVDATLDNNVDNKFSPNIGSGLYFHSDKTYIGFSIPNFLQTKHFDQSASSGIAKESMHYYFTAGHVFDLDEDIKFKPVVLSKVVSGAPLQFDLSANFMFYNKFVLGAAYRSISAFSAMVGFQATNSWYIGYGYDREITRLSNFNSGSHEVFLRYELFNKDDEDITPRFF